MKPKKNIPMAQTTVIRRLGRFVLSLHVAGTVTGAFAPSRVSSEGGSRGVPVVVGRGREDTPLRLMFRAKEGCGGGKHVLTR
jgi:hypothetical protein